MFECMFMETHADFEWTWGDASSKVKAGTTMLKKIIKKTLDKESYRNFWKFTNCRCMLESITDKGTISVGGRIMKVPDFERLYEVYSSLITRTVKGGIVKSWFELVRKYKDNHLLMLSTFGVDSRKLILETVENEDDVALFAVNYEKWGIRDKDKFEEQYAKPVAGFSASHDDYNSLITDKAALDALMDS